MAIQIKSLDSESREAWADFVNRSDEAWFHHHPEKIELEQLPYPAHSRSFMALDEQRQILGIFPLMEAPMDVFGFPKKTLYSPGCSGPALANDLSPAIRQDVLDALFAHLHELARQEGVLKTTVFTSPLTPKRLAGLFFENELTRYGFFDASFSTRILDLSLTQDGLWTQMTKGHRYEVRRAEKQSLSFHVFDQQNITMEKIRSFYDLHVRTYARTGKKPEPYASFEKRFGMVRQGFGLLYSVQRGDVPEAFAYITCFKRNAQYTLGASDDSKSGQNHFLQWKIIQHLKKAEYRLYELGWQPRPTDLFMQPTSKESGISQFKRGFGGMDVSVLGGECYYSALYSLLTTNVRLLKFWKSRQSQDRESD